MLASQALAADVNQTRVLVLLTDGQEVSSDATLEQAIAAARAANVAVYPIGIESPSFRPGAAPAPRRRRPAAATRAPAGRRHLQAVYAALARELRRTWQLSYVTSARPGEQLEVEAAGASAEAVVPGRGRPCRRLEASKLPEPFFKVGPVLDGDRSSAS